MAEDFTENKKMLSVMEIVDLVSEIFLRLPVESLYRLKCVSTHCRFLVSSFISNSKSCSTHTQMNHKSSIFGVYFYFNVWDTEELGLKSVSLRRAGQSLPTLEYLNLANNTESVILHASNGLFLCSIGYEKPYAICNLTTQQFNLLPQHPSVSSFQYSISSSHLDFDPKKSLHFKVVRVGWLCGEGTLEHYRDGERVGEYHEPDGEWYQIDIYTSETETWKRRHFPAFFGFHSEYKVLWNGAIHWMTDSDCHVRFEIDTETLNANTLPPQIDDEEDDHIRYFGECNGHLFLIQIERHDCENFHILEMDNDFSWNVKRTVDMLPPRNIFNEIFTRPDPVPYGEGGVRWKFSILCVIEEDGNNDTRVLLALPGKIILMGRRTIEVLCTFPPTEFFLEHLYNHAIAFPFIPSLYPV